nr:hypothetical protein [Candidatus Woesearchaeota archaeon]
MAEKTRCEICDRTFGNADGLTAHNKAKHPELAPKEKKSFPIKKIMNWAIFIVVVGLIVWGIIGLVNKNAANKTIIDESNLNFEAPIGAIHWHPHLTIKIDGEIIPIPADIGITSTTHFPIHTHETDGIIHMENNNPTKKTVVLGYFFEVWGKKLSKDCIFDYCADKGTLKMSVNGKENFDFENYFMQDGDEILIEYTSN